MNVNAVSSSQASDSQPGFSEYFGIVKKRSRLLVTVAVPIVSLGALLALGLPDIYRSSGLIEIEEAQNLRNAVAREQEEAPYADEYVRSLSTVVFSDANLRRLLKEQQLYEDQADDVCAALKQIKRDIDVKIVTVPIWIRRPDVSENRHRLQGRIRQSKAEARAGGASGW